MFSKARAAAHALGTDTLGRDVLSRLMYGARPTLVAVAIAIAVYTVWGSALGLLAGYLAGWTDRVVGVYSSILLAMPHIVILFVFLSVYRGNVYLAMLVFGFIASPVMVLVVRGSALCPAQRAVRRCGEGIGSVPHLHHLAPHPPPNDAG